MTSASTMGFRRWFGAWMPCRLPFVRLVRGLRVGVGGRACRAAWECGPDRGWSGRFRGRAAGVCPQVLPGVLAVVAGGQVEDEVPAAVAGGPGGHGDQVAADGGGACPGVAGPGPGPGGAQQVV